MLDEFGVFPAVVARELERYLPFLATTKVLMAAVRNGVGRETAHEVIKEHAVGGGAGDAPGAERNDLLARLAADPRLGPRRRPAGRAGGRADRFTGAAVAQVREVVARVERVLSSDPDAAAYTPSAIL